MVSIVINAHANDIFYQCEVAFRDDYVFYSVHVLLNAHVDGNDKMNCGHDCWHRPVA